MHATWKQSLRNQVEILKLFRQKSIKLELALLSDTLASQNFTGISAILNRISRKLRNFSAPHVHVRSKKQSISWQNISCS